MKAGRHSKRTWMEMGGGTPSLAAVSHILHTPKEVSLLSPHALTAGREAACSEFWAYLVTATLQLSAKAHAFHAVPVQTRKCVLSLLTTSNEGPSTR